MTTLLATLLGTAILGLRLSSLWRVLPQFWPDIGEPDRSRKTTQVPTLLAFLSRERQRG